MTALLLRYCRALERVVDEFLAGAADARGWR